MQAGTTSALWSELGGEFIPVSHWRGIGAGRVSHIDVNVPSDLIVSENQAPQPPSAFMKTILGVMGALALVSALSLF